MKKIKLKINDWDGASLIVTAIGDTSEKDFDHYPSLAYQPAFFDVADVETLLRQIAKSSVSVVESTEKIERFSKSETLQQELSEIVGNVYEWDIAELYSNDIVESSASEQTLTENTYATLSVEEKLALAGISLQDLKKALGLTS